MAKTSKHNKNKHNKNRHNKVIKPRKLVLVITDKPITKRKTQRRLRTPRRKRRTHKKKRN